MENPAFHTAIYQALREEYVPAVQAMAFATIECAECGGYADHWHTMTGTTHDDHEQDLFDLVYGVTLHSDIPMACGHEAELSLASVSDWYPHCDDCSVPKSTCRICQIEYPDDDLDDDSLCDDCRASDDSDED
jgi:hypothetical protein